MAGGVDRGGVDRGGGGQWWQWWGRWWLVVSRWWSDWIILFILLRTVTVLVVAQWKMVI